MAQPVFDTGNLTPGSPSAGLLFCQADDFFDSVKVAAAVNVACEKASDPKSLRLAPVAPLAAAYKAGFDLIAAHFAKRPNDSDVATRSFSMLTDRLVLEVFRCVTTRLHPNPDAGPKDRLAIFAVGGYGRGEMAPYSDVDLLLLTPDQPSAWSQQVVESVLYILWDLKLKVGNATRTIKECLKLGRQDYTIRTALLENRFLGGDQQLATDLGTSLWADLFEGTGPDFIEAKLAERVARHQRQGGQRYMVEPNVKEGKGGLRDLQSMFWIAKYLHRVTRTEDLATLGMFSASEFERFNIAEKFLWSVRCHLHLISGRASDQLTFDAQVEVAQALGFTDGGGQRAVEHFMQSYFTQATIVGELTRIFLTDLEARHVKKQPSVTGFLASAGKRLSTRLSSGYKLTYGRLAIVDNDLFLSDPLNLLRLFEEGLRTGYLIHPDAMRLVASNLGVIDDDMRNSADANRIFLDLLLAHGNPERALRRMNELGVLGAFIPEFQPIVAMMQFNMYHHFTVDEHTIQCISHLSKIEHGDYVVDLPVASEILKEGVNRKVLYIALLMHDIGKGRKEDHSVLGAQIAAVVCPRLGLGPEECATVEWLVGHHLVMSDVAQKRDLSDPRTVRDFARTVERRSRLDLLTVLTVCDIRGVGPGTWNNWKAQLLRELYGATNLALRSGMDDIGKAKREDEAKAALADVLHDWDADKLSHELDRHYGPYWQGLNTETHAIFAHLSKGVREDEIRSDIKPDPDRDATRACFVLADHPGIFSRLAGALALVGANVLDARTYTSSDGFATSVFWVQDERGHPYDKSRLARLKSTISKTLNGDVVARDALQARDKIKKRERKFVVPTSVTFDNEGSEIYTIVEVDTRDRPGLLYDLTRTISAANIYIASAVIATYGAQAVDVFYVKDMFGLKLHSKAKRNSLEQKLREAIEAGAERAVS